MVKDADSPYEAGRRGGAWRKVKPVHTLDLVVLAVEWGSGRRQGWLSNLHLGARDPEAPGEFVMVGKTFKGLTDELLTWQTERFLELETDRTATWCVVRPELVVEIALDGVQSSTRYAGGVALRFARVRRYRDRQVAGRGRHHRRRPGRCPPAARFHPVADDGLTPCIALGPDLADERRSRAWPTSAEGLAMAHEVRGVIARNKGEPVSDRDRRRPRPGPGRGAGGRPGVRGVPHRPALPRGRHQRRLPLPARPRGGRRGRGRRRRRHRRRPGRLRGPQLAGGVRPLPRVPQGPCRTSASPPTTPPRR